MAIRTTRTQVSFSAPFSLPEIDELLPAGTYEIETDDEVHEGNERRVYVRVATLLHLRGQGWSRTVTINPDSLEAALRNDREILR